MSIFKIDGETAQQLSLKKDGFGSEQKLRDFFAKNLEAILGVRFLENEYQTTDGRIDTLGIDENDSPVIIEYKWKENQEILTQGLFYFDWLAKNKPHFELLVAKHLGKSAKVTWDQPRLILIAQGFSRYIRAAVQTVSNVELKTYNLYEGNILHVENQYSPKPEKPFTHNKASKPETEITYDLTYLLKSISPEMQKLTNELHEKILELPSVEEKIDKTGITYRTTKNFTRLDFKKKWVQLLLRDPHYQEDTNKLVKDITTYGWWGYRGMVKFKPDTDVNYLFGLVKASHHSTQ